MKEFWIVLYNPWNFVALLTTLLILVLVLLRTGREFKIGKYIVIPSRNDIANLDFKKIPYLFQRKMIEDLTEGYHRRIKRIIDLNYQESMNWENDFLKRVSALFSGADRVYAVTLSSISDFWISESDRQLIIKYLRCQENKEVYRLFVFKSPHDLMLYEEVLLANARAYGSRGGVFVTSSQNYQINILKKMCDKRSIYNIMDKDFGVWESKDISVMATLQGTQLNFHKIDKSKIEEVDTTELKSVFKNVPGGVERWDERSRAEDVAKKIFNDSPIYGGPVIHLVFLKHENSELLRKISNTIIELDKIQRNAIDLGVSINFDQKDPWWGINIQSIDSMTPFSDGKYLGQLRCDDEFQYLLMIQLPSLDDLREWYRYGPHSDIRRKVYSQILESVKIVYEEIRCGSNLAASEFQKIEEMIWDSRRLKRMDFIFNKKISDVQPFRIYQQYIDQQDLDR